MAQKNLYQNCQRHRSRLSTKTIVLLFCISIALVTAAFVSIYVPRFVIHPENDILFCKSTYSSRCSDQYIVTPANQVEIIEKFADSDSEYPYTFHYYDSDQDKSHIITIAEAKTLTFHRSYKSPDGYLLRQHTDSGGAFTGYHYDQTWSIKKGILSKPITLNNNKDASVFIGWVIPKPI